MVVRTEIQSRSAKHTLINMKVSHQLKHRIAQKYGKWAIVTGASSGIGQELALQIAACGLHTILVARNNSKLSDLKAQIEGQYGTQVITISLDLGSDSVHPVIDAAKGKEVGLLVASAGFGTSGPLINGSLPEEVNMLKVNCESLLAITHHYAQYFARQKRGGIILLSSMVAFQGVPFAAHYAATKAYVQTLAEGLYHELKPLNVDIIAAAPGPVQTGFGARAHMKMGNVLTPEDIAVPILKALGGKMTVLPGLLTKILVYSLRTVPRWGKIRIMKLVMSGMTKHQQTTK